MKSFWAVVVVGLGLAGNAGASRYEIPLAELKGVYSTAKTCQPTLDWGPDRRTASFDIGYGFERVDSVRIHVMGTIAPALFWEWRPPREVIIHPDGSVERVGERQWEAMPLLTAALGDVGQSESSFVVASLDVDGAFDAESNLWLPVIDPLTQTQIPVPGFLAQGHGEVEILLWQGIYPEWGGQVVPAVAGITDAKLIVEGVAVPEPGAGLVLLPAVLLLARRRRKVD